MTLRNQFSFLGIKKIDSSLVFISCALVVYPATVLLVPKINGLIFGLFSLFGLFTLFKYRGKYTKPDRSETLFYFSVGVFFLATLLITLNAGFVYKVFGKHIHVLLVIPVYIYLCHVGVRLVFVWYGFFAGSIIAAGIAIYDVGITDTSAYWGNGGLRAMGITHPIIFGDLALAMGCMSIAGYGWFKHRGKLQASLPAIAMICGLFASVLSGSRGSWVALPFLIVVFFWYINAHFSIKQKVATATMVALTLCALYLIPQTKVSFHIDKTVNSIQQYSENDAQSRKRATSMGLRFEMWQVRKRATSVGTRFEMWRAAWKMYLDNPVLGVGWGHYREQAQQQVDQGLRNRSAASFDHPHSEYFTALASGGTVGFITLMILYLIPAGLFIKHIRQGETADIRRLALAGLMLVVAYMAFGLSEPMLYRSRSANFFAFYLAVFMAAISTEQSKQNSQKTEAVRIAG